MLSVINFQFPSIPHVFCAFQTRELGSSLELYSQGNISFDVGDKPEHVIENRKEITKTLEVQCFSDVQQVHNVHTLFNPAPATASASLAIEADGMATAASNQALCIKTADCQPILITDQKGEYILALHAGWKGNRQNYPYLAVKEFCKFYQLKANHLFAVRGPSLSPLASQFINFDTEWGPEFAQFFQANSQTMNLWQLTIHQLQEAGIPRQQIYSIDLCTYSNPHSFFSYRKNNTTGRQGSFIWKI